MDKDPIDQGMTKTISRFAAYAYVGESIMKPKKIL